LATVVTQRPLESESRVTRATLAAQVEEAIRLDIIAGILEPGQRLRAAELTKQYGVSATPLREALQRLAAQNLIELGPRLGATVAPISESELHDIYDMRQLLEGEALERSVKSGGDQWKQSVHQAYEALEQAAARDTGQSPADILAWSSVHRAFHDSLFQACGSEWLLRFVAILSDHSQRYRMLSRRRSSRPTSEEHKAIFDAAMAGDAAKARDALRVHLAKTVDVLETATSAAERGD
jgi:GntR family carbon starvation induced transcriptional regulator